MAKKFDFRLERVLRYRKQLQQQAEMRQQAAQNQLNEARADETGVLQEFAQAAALIDIKGHTDAFIPDTPMTLFERKYADRGHTLWRFRGKCVN